MKLILKVKGLITGVLFLIWTFIASVSITATSLMGWRKGADFVFRNWGIGGCWLFGVKIVCHHFDRVQKDKGVLLLFNHQSHVDILVMAASVPKSFRFGAKIELFKIPLFGFAMRAAGTLPIARQNRAEVFRVYKEAESRVRSGESFALAPEGTRQPIPEIGPFKKGPFVFARGAHAPVQPVIIYGAYDVMSKKNLLPNDRAWFKTVHVALGTVIESTDYPEDQLDLFVQKVREETVQIYTELRNQGPS